MSNAISHFGWDSIKSTVLHTDLSQDDASKMEKELIKKYKSNDIRFGYNYTNGGLDRYDFSVREETKMKISNSSKGKIKTVEHLKNIAESNMIPVVQFSVDGLFLNEYTSLKDAEKYGFSHAKISNVCQGKMCTHCGFIWRYKTDVLKDDKICDIPKSEVESIKRQINRSRSSNNNSTKVYQYKKDGSFVKCWDCLQDACDFYNRNHSSIISSCKNKSCFCAGFKWDYLHKTQEEVKQIIKNNKLITDAFCESVS